MNALNQLYLRWKPSRDTWIALLVATTFFMENLDSTIITTALPAMARDFHVTPIDLNVGISAYVLTLGIFIPISGWMAERFGARRIFSLAIIIFTATSQLCGMINSLKLFILLRILQAIGGAMMVPVGRLMILRNTPKELLMKAIATLTWPGLAAPVLGPPIGGAITTYFSWRWIFYLNLPIGLLSLAAALWLIPQDKTTQPKPFDWIGFALMSIGIPSTLWGLELISQTATSWFTIGSYIAVGLSFLGLALRHMQNAPHPMVNFAVLNIPSFAITFWGGSLFRIAISSVPFLAPLLFQVGFGMSAVQTGVLVMAMFAGNLFMKLFTTALLRRYGYRTILIRNGVLNVFALASCALLTSHTALWTIAALLFAGGLMRSMQFTTVNTLAFADVPQSQMSEANTLFSTGFQFCMGLGIALSAIALRFSAWLIPHLGFQLVPDVPYRCAFILMASLSAWGTLFSLKLSKQAGEQLVLRH